MLRSDTNINPSSGARRFLDWVTRHASFRATLEVHRGERQRVSSRGHAHAAMTKPLVDNVRNHCRRNCYGNDSRQIGIGLFLTKTASGILP